MKIYSFINQKGGVGKTTSAVTLAHGLALQGYRTLLVDCDSQGHVATQLGLEKLPALRRWFYDEEPLSAVIQMARENLWVITGEKSTDRVLGRMREEQWGTVEFAERLREESQSEEMDAVLLDLAPSLNHLQVAAMLASDTIIIPTRLRFTDLDGVNEITRSITETARRSQSEGRYYLLPTFFDRVTKETHQRLSELANAFGKKVLPPIPQDVKLSEAPGYAMTIWEYAPNAPSIRGYTNGNGKTVGGYAAILEELINQLEVEA